MRSWGVFLLVFVKTRLQCDTFDEGAYSCTEFSGKLISFFYKSALVSLMGFDETETLHPLPPLSFSSRGLGSRFSFCCIVTSLMSYVWWTHFLLSVRICSWNHWQIVYLHQVSPLPALAQLMAVSCCAPEKKTVLLLAVNIWAVDLWDSPCRFSSLPEAFLLRRKIW